ncbi:MAG: porin family protein [Sphingomonadaceae bacterium]|jgi:outer membrane immunogenic protein|nr:MAG: porin family protein [Sphingomonadaceae bacterium]
MTMRLTAALSILALIGAVPAAAQDRVARPFEGGSVTLIAGVDGANRYSDWSAGAVYGGQIGYDWQRDGLVVGVEGELTGSSNRQCNVSYSTSGGNSSLCVKAGRDAYVGGRVGTPIGAATLLYGKVGYTNVEQTFAARQTTSGTVDGFRLGAGVEHHVSDRTTLKAEYRYANYDGGYDRHQAVVGLGFRF